ncbi:zinc-binding dehydrogenase [Amycolatopsis methanolica]|uniref:zinc-binding dehydrogenase n=1 Tax=Amycolatopsis methanolica TaxID=1814 RepID=UPI001CC258A9|nr:zinc-binding dehydrogenase [Amycolatopsis methanolica]
MTREPGSVSIEEIDKPVPAMGEVLVRLAATGICHTDLSMVSGALPAPLPFVPGHEGAGVVEATGPGVEDVGVGDHVVLSIVVSCGSCYQCGLGNLSICEVGSAMAPGGLLLDGTTRLSNGGEEFHSLLCQSSLAEYAVVPSNSAVPIPKDIPFPVASLLACGGGTGFGAVVRRTTLWIGSSVVVIGCGGVGLTAIMAAKVRGATTIIAVDPSAGARAMAEKVGATHVLDPDGDRVLRSVMELTGRGADVAIDAVGRKGTVETAFQSIRAGGEVVAVGIDDASNEVELDLYGFMMQKRVTGTYAGSLVPRIDIPAALALYRDGRLPLDVLVSETYTLDDVPGLLTNEIRLPPGRAVVCFDQPEERP